MLQEINKEKKSKTENKEIQKQGYIQYALHGMRNKNTTMHKVASIYKAGIQVLPESVDLIIVPSLLTATIFVPAIMRR